MKTIGFCLLIAISNVPSQTIRQNCMGDDCVQIGKNIGVVNIEGGTIQIAVNKGHVNITYVGDPKDKVKIKNYDIKIANLTAQIQKRLALIQQQDKRRLSDMEKLIKADECAQGLIRQIDQLNERIVKLDEHNALTKKIKDARDKYDVPLIIQLLKEKQKLDDRTAAETAFELAGFQKVNLEYMEAYSNYQKAVLLDSANSLYLNNAGIMAGILGSYKEGIRLYEFALASDLKTYGEGHPDVAIRRNNLGLAWYALGEYKKAIGYYEIALASDLKTYGEGHPDVAIRRNNLGLAWYALGEYKKAIGYLELALAVFEKTLGMEHPTTVTGRNNLEYAKLKLAEGKN